MRWSRNGIPIATATSTSRRAMLEGQASEGYGAKPFRGAFCGESFALEPIRRQAGKHLIKIPKTTKYIRGNDFNSSTHKLIETGALEINSDRKERTKHTTKKIGRAHV